MDTREIVKALYCCARNKSDDTCEYCRQCAMSEVDFLETSKNCDDDLLTRARILIQEQNQEIEELKYKLSETYLSAIEKVTEDTNKQIWQNALDLYREVKEMVLKDVRAEIVNEMVEKIREYYNAEKYQPTDTNPQRHTRIDHLFNVLEEIAKEVNK